jgi:glycosyltransferase involved in cell wall biosynthesis
LEALQERFCVVEKHLTGHRLEPLSLWRDARANDVVFGWFASWHTFLPMLYARLLGKRSLLVIGGYDIANIRELGYGHQRSGIKKWISRATMRLAQLLVTNSSFSAAEARENAALHGRRIEVVYHGIPDEYGALPTNHRESMALTVGEIDGPNLRRKGIEPFVRAAALLPHVRFVVAGRWKDGAVNRLRALAAANVEFTGWLDDALLVDCYRRASVYVQISRHEGFGMSVAEAMLCGCFPVVTSAGALPEVVGDCGIYCPSQDPVRVAAAIRKALEVAEENRARIRERVLTKFKPQTRADTLARMVLG